MRQQCSAAYAQDEITYRAALSGGTNERLIVFLFCIHSTTIAQPNIVGVIGLLSDVIGFEIAIQNHEPGVNPLIWVVFPVGTQVDPYLGAGRTKICQAARCW